MKRWLMILVTVTVATLLVGPNALPVIQAKPAPQNQAGSPGWMFIENVGQFPGGARFMVRNGSSPVWLADDAIWITLTETRRETSGPRQRDKRLVSMPSLNIRLSFPGANPRPRLEPFNRQDVNLSYYLGNDPALWRENVPVWGGVRYVDVYPGVDLEITGQGGHWSWSVRARDASRLANVRLRVEGANAVEIESGQAHISTALGELRLPLLQATGMTENRLRAPALAGDEIVNPYASTVAHAPASVTGPNSPASPLLLSTFLGGSGWELIQGMAVDTGSALYVTGETRSSDFPVTPGLDNTLAGAGDAFVAKLNSSGTQLVYATLVGGVTDVNNPFQTPEAGYGIAVDNSGNAYVAGTTQASDFPTTLGAFDQTYNGPNPCGIFSPPRACSDAFVIKLDSTGHLAYGTFLGGSGFSFPGGSRSGGEDTGRDIAFKNGYVYVTGRADSDDFPTTPGAFKRVFANVDIGLNADVFVTKLKLDGNGENDLMYSTFVGGGCKEEGEAIVVDDAGIAYVTGTAYGDAFPANSDFPTTPGAFDRMLWQSGEDAFIVKLKPAGSGDSDLMYSTFLGSDDTQTDWAYDWGRGIAVDSSGNIYVTGLTASLFFPTTPGAFIPAPNVSYWGQSAFVSKLYPGGRGQADLVYSTYLGAGNDAGRDIAIDSSGDIYVTGETGHLKFPITPGAYDPYLSGYRSAFASRLRPQGLGTLDLIYSTFLGGSEATYGYALALGQNDSVYVAGYTTSYDFPTTPGALDTTLGGSGDAFITHLQLTYGLSGRTLDRQGAAISSVTVSVSGGYSGTTDYTGWYTIAVPSGQYAITPTHFGYMWQPSARTVAVSRSVGGQDFTGVNFLKEAAPGAMPAVAYGDTLTYTLRFLYPTIARAALYDLVPTYTTFISGSLVSSKTGVEYDAATNAISGTLFLSGGTPATVTFAVRVNVTGTAESAPIIRNQARVCPPPGYSGSCEWSNPVMHYTFVFPIYLPLVSR